jgi:hypothetical protein
MALVLQPPQLLMSSVMLTSHPLEFFPSQSSNPVEQAILQMLLEQLGVPFVELQAWPHPPQFVTVVVFVSHPLEAFPSQFAVPVPQEIVVQA